MKQLSKDKAIELYQGEKWKEWSDKALVGFQLFQERLCVPFDVFHAAIERVFDRPVWTHEFGLNHDSLIAEYLGKAPKPSFEDIINLISKEKCLIVAS